MSVLAEVSSRAAFIKSAAPSHRYNKHKASSSVASSGGKFSRRASGTNWSFSPTRNTPSRSLFRVTLRSKHKQGTACSSVTEEPEVGSGGSGNHGSGIGNGNDGSGDGWDSDDSSGHSGSNIYLLTAIPIADARASGGEGELSVDDDDVEYIDDDDDDDDDDEDDDDDDSDDESSTNTARAANKPKNRDNFICESVLATNLPTGPGIPTKSELFQGLNARKGAELSKKDLSDDLEQLLNTGLFANVDANVTPKQDGYAVEFVFREKIWPQVQSFRVAGSTALPKDVEQEVLKAARKSQNCTVRVLATAKNIVEGYYTSKGLTFGTISHFDGMENGEVIAHVVEGEITRVQAVFVDENLQPMPGNKGVTHPRVIQREHNFKVGKLYNVEDAKTALRDIFLLQLFDNVQVVPRPDERDPSKIEVDILLRERPTKTAETELEWSIAPGENGRPDLVSARPGGSVFFEHRNLDSWGRQLFGSISTANFLEPQEDLGFKLEYNHPYCKGDADSDKTSFKAAAFNSRKLSPVFTGGPLIQDVPGIWVDRAGIKATVCQNFTKQSKCSLGMVLEEVTTRDDSGAVCASGAKQLPNGSLSLDGPRTTLSDTGTDRVMFLQGNVTRDTTTFVNGTQVGARDIFQIDQSIPFWPKRPIFNRSEVELTRFVQLLPENKKNSLPPPVVVLHTRAGHILGNCAAYDAFALGGPHSCRGYTVGELGAARSLLETAVEIRLPVPVLKTHGFLFWEQCSDLSSSSALSGNPTEFYRRAGKGSTHGVGIKLGPVRAEWCIDNNSGTASTYVRFGERF